VLLATLWCQPFVHGQQAQTVLPTDMETRQAAALAASVVPPTSATVDMLRLSGEYSYGNGFDMNCTLEISPDGRFVYRKCNCETVVDQATGTAVINDGVVQLNPDKPRNQWPLGTGPELVPVAWGQRLYLVPQNDILGFSNQVNRGVEPISRGNMGSYYLREGDWDRPAEGKPVLPEEWQTRLLDKPIQGRVAGQDPSGRWIIDLGKEDGVFNLMELSAWSPDLQKFVSLRVTETGTDTSAVEILNSRRPIGLQGWIVYSKVAPPAK